MLAQSTYRDWGKIVDAFNQKLTILKCKSVLFNSQTADGFLSILEENPRQSGVLREGVCLALQFGGPDGFNTVSSVAQNLVSKYGDIFFTTNGVATSAAHDLIFGPAMQDTATLDNCTCCIIKPHALKTKIFGSILDLIVSQGYEVSAVRSLYFEKVQAEEFLEVYKVGSVFLVTIEIVYCIIFVLVTVVSI